MNELWNQYGVLFVGAPRTFLYSNSENNHLAIANPCGLKHCLVGIEFPGRMSFHLVNAPLDVRGKVSSIPILKFINLPVVASDMSTAVVSAALAIEFIIGTAIAHGIVKADLFANLDVAQRIERDLPDKPGIGIA